MSLEAEHREKKGNGGNEKGKAQKGKVDEVGWLAAR